MPFDELLSAFEKLLSGGTIRPVGSGQPVETIRLCYMVENTENGYEYYPVWNFEVSYVSEMLKDFGGYRQTRYVVLDARDGKLVDYNNGGA